MEEPHGRTTIQKGSERSFGIVFAVVFAAIGLWPWMDGAGARSWALALACAFLASAFLAPRLLKPLNAWWLELGLLLGRIVAPVVMTLLFYLVVTPTGLVMRALGKDLLRLRLDPTAKTYWLNRKTTEQPMGSMRNQF